MQPTYEKVDQLTMRKVITKEVILDLPELRTKKRLAVEARNRFLAEAAAQQTIIDEIDADITEGQKIGVSESIDIGEPVREELTPDPEIVK